MNLRTHALRAVHRTALAAIPLALIPTTTARTAAAADFSVKLEPGVAIPLTTPQSQRFDVGGAQSLKVLLAVAPFLDVGAATSFTLLPPSTPGAESGVAWGYGAGLRVRRPRDAESFYGISPWADADLLYVRTGQLDRPGFDGAVGLAVPLTWSRMFWVGPFVRYFQTVQPERTGYDNHDAKILTLGISFEVTGGRERPRDEAPPDRMAPAPVAAAPCADRDADGLPDSVDHCPDVAGPIENSGCPKYDKVVVKPDKLELKEVILFAWDQDTLDPASTPALDDVVKALTDNRGFRVQVEGHADSSGSDNHNQRLSERRAQRVVDYLVARGIAKDRVTSKGFSSSVPTNVDTQGTVAGRELNRRVEFVVSFLILNAGAAR